jgi:hypothetical protein
MAALLHRARRVAAPSLRVVPSKAADYLVVGGGFAGSIMAERLGQQRRQGAGGGPPLPPRRQRLRRA